MVDKSLKDISGEPWGEKFSDLDSPDSQNIYLFEVCTKSLKL